MLTKKLINLFSFLKGVKKIVTKERGLFLGILLFLYLLVQIIYFILSLLPFIFTNYDWKLPLWMKILQPLLSLVAIGSIVSLYYWKKQGFYLILAVLVVNTIVNALTGSTLFDLVEPFIGLGLLSWAIYRKRELFE